MQNVAHHLSAPHHLAPPAMGAHGLYGGPGAPAHHDLAPAPQVAIDPDNAVHIGVAKLTELKECVEDVSKDASKFFDKGNKAAGVRARKKLQQLKQLAQDLRVNIQKCKQELAAGGGAPGAPGGPGGHHLDPDAPHHQDPSAHDMTGGVHPHSAYGHDGLE